MAAASVRGSDKPTGRVTGIDFPLPARRDRRARKYDSALDRPFRNIGPIQDSAFYAAAEAVIARQRSGGEVLVSVRHAKNLRGWLICRGSPVMASVDAAEVNFTATVGERGIAPGWSAIRK